MLKFREDTQEFVQKASELSSELVVVSITCSEECRTVGDENYLRDIWNTLRETSANRLLDPARVQEFSIS